MKPQKPNKIKNPRTVPNNSLSPFPGINDYSTIKSIKAQEKNPPFFCISRPEITPNSHISLFPEPHSIIPHIKKRKTKN
jgi:hypothetical protein